MVAVRNVTTGCDLRPATILHTHKCRSSAEHRGWVIRQESMNIPATRRSTPRLRLFCVPRS
jgi:hypothetical protein